MFFAKKRDFSVTVFRAVYGIIIMQKRSLKNFYQHRFSEEMQLQMLGGGSALGLRMASNVETEPQKKLNYGTRFALIFKLLLSPETASFKNYHLLL